jgi:hypothetical protein
MASVMKKGDRRPRYRVALTVGGTAVDLTGATGVRFIMKSTPASGTTKVDAAATVVTAATGIVEYAWGATDTDTAGDYVIEFEVNWSGEKQTFPSTGYFTLTIESDLA